MYTRPNRTREGSPRTRLSPESLIEWLSTGGAVGFAILLFLLVGGSGGVADRIHLGGLAVRLCTREVGSSDRNRGQPRATGRAGIAAEPDQVGARAGMQPAPRRGRALGKRLNRDAGSVGSEGIFNTECLFRHPPASRYSVHSGSGRGDRDALQGSRGRAWPVRTEGQRRALFDERAELILPVAPFRTEPGCGECGHEGVLLGPEGLH